jgi:uncharacterized membrane protein
VLNVIALWLFFVPFSIENIINRLLVPTLSPLSLVGIIVMLMLNIVILWGGICVLIVGKRLLISQAGRSRTSFHAVQKQATSLIVPVLLTSILRGSITLLWSLLFIIPGIIYSIRTTFYSIVIVYEGLSYRSALQRSKEIIKGKTWQTFLRILGITIFLFAPVMIIDFALESIISSMDSRFVFTVDIIDGGLMALATILYFFSLMLIYGELKKRPKEFIPPPLHE